ncbi:MAG: hypothetical protein ACK4PK_01935 [Alphaproteobacteria bacterium]
MTKTTKALLALTLTATFGAAAVYGLKDTEFKTPLATPEDSAVAICINTVNPALHTLNTGETMVVRSLAGGKSWEFTDIVTKQKTRIKPEDLPNITCASVKSPLKTGKQSFGH